MDRFAFFSFLASACFAAAAGAETLTLPVVPDATGTLRLAGVGDVMVHQSVKYTARAQDEKDGTSSGNNNGWNHLFEDVADVLNVADVSFANLETPLVEAPAADPWF